MPFDITKSVEIIEIMENYLSIHRPEPEMRKQLDLSYEIEDTSVVLNEIRPSWSKPSETMTIPYAKATFVKAKNIWKVYWMRSNMKWDEYQPNPTVNTLKEFLTLVDLDKHGCFKG